MFSNFLVPTELHVSAGDKVILNTYALISKTATVHDVHIIWEKDDQNVLELKNGNITYGPGFEGRAYISVDRILKGNLSLYMYSVRKTDQGIYWCRHSGRSYAMMEAYPNAFYLNVETGNYFLFT